MEIEAMLSELRTIRTWFVKEACKTEDEDTESLLMAVEDSITEIINFIEDGEK